MEENKGKGVPENNDVHAGTSNSCVEDNINIVDNDIAAHNEAVARRPVLLDTSPGIEVHDEPVIGIDIGTSKCCMTILEDGVVKVITDDDGNRLIPSYVAFIEDAFIFGEAAKLQLSLDPHNTIFGVKMLIGKKFSNLTDEEILSLWPSQVVKGELDEPEIIMECHGKKKHYTAGKILSLMLENLKLLAEKRLNRGPIKNVVITVPSYFKKAEFAVVSEAATAAGLKIQQFVNEQIAAAVAHKYMYNFDEVKTMLVFDLGGGSINVRLLKFTNCVVESLMWAATDLFGGHYFDQHMFNHLLEVFNDEHHLDIGRDEKCIGRLRDEYESAKKRLCVENCYSTQIVIDSFYQGKDMRETISRSKFEYLNRKLFMKCIQRVKACLRGAKVGADDVDEIIVVGGASRIPRIRELLQDLFPGKTLLHSIVCNQEEEVVASGAGIIGAMLADQNKDDYLVEFCPLAASVASFGLRWNDGTMRVLIPRNTKVGFEKSISLSNQRSFIALDVYEGENYMAADNNLLGTLQLSGINGPSSSGAFTSEVHFSVFSENKLQVILNDTFSGVNVVKTFDKKHIRLSHKEIAETVRENANINSDEKENRRRQLALNELLEYKNILTVKLNNEKVKSSLSDFLQDYLHSAILDVANWLEDYGQRSKSSEIEQVMNHLQLMAEPFKGYLGNIYI